MITHIFNSDLLTNEATKALNAHFKNASNNPFLFLMSGGSSLALLNLIDTSNFNEKSTVAVSDERYSTDPAVNNLAQIEKTLFYKAVTKNGASVIDSKPGAGELMNELGARFDESLKKWIKNNPTGIIIASAGIGPDAHTTGIMPYPEDNELFEKTFDDSSLWAVAYDAKNKNQYNLRITITLPFIRKINHVVIFASGNSKKNALTKLLSNDGTLNESPCRIWRELKDVQLFTDQEI